jgi:hypothetical protein
MPCSFQRNQPSDGVAMSLGLIFIVWPATPGRQKPLRLREKPGPLERPQPGTGVRCGTTLLPAVVFQNHMLLSNKAVR